MGGSEGNVGPFKGAIPRDSHWFARRQGQSRFQVLPNPFGFGYRRVMEYLELLGQSVRDHLVTHFRFLALIVT